MATGGASTTPATTIINSNSTTDYWYSDTQAETDPAESHILHIRHNLWLFWTPVIIFGGTIANGLSLLVLRCPEFRHTTIAFTLSALAVSDTGVLYTGALRRWVLIITDNQMEYVVISVASCRIFNFFTYLFSHLSSWTIVLVTLERVLSVRFPFRAKGWCTRCKMISIWLVILLLLVGVNLHFLWNLTIVTVEEDGYSDRYCEFKDENLYDIVYWLDFFLLAALPCTIILISNTVIIVTLARRRTRRLQQQQQQQQLQQQNVANRYTSSDTRQALHRSLTPTLLVVSFVFILTTLPITIYFRVAKYEVKTNLEAAKLSLAFAVCNLLYYTSNAINFFLYVLTGQGFRRAMLRYIIQLECCFKRDSREQDAADQPALVALLTQAGRGASNRTVTNATASSNLELNHVNLNC